MSAQRQKPQISVAMATLAILALVVVGGGVLWFLRAGPSSGGSSEPDPVVVTWFNADLDVTADGTLTVVETFDAVFPYGRHGVYRFWDEADPVDSSARSRVTEVYATRDGNPEPLEVWREGTVVVAKIGDPDVLLVAGSHRYVLSYTVSDVLRPVRDVATLGATVSGARDGSEQSVFAWWVVAPFWEMRILSGSAHVRLPSPVTEAMCRTTAPDGCTVDGTGTTSISVRVGDMRPRTGVEVAAYSAATPGAGSQLPWGPAWDLYLGDDPGFVGFLLVLTLCGAAAAAALVWRARERPPGAPLVYEPPRGLGPVQCEYLITETTGDHALTATVLHLADLGVVTLEGDHGAWAVRRTGYARSPLDPVAEAVLAGLQLDETGDTFTARADEPTGALVRHTVAALETAVDDWAGAGLWRRDPVVVAGRVAVMLSLGIGAVLGLNTPMLSGLPFVAFALVGAPVLATGMARRRTPGAREAWMQALGFRTFLSTPSSEDRYDFAARDSLWIAYVPYAVAFGCADAWAGKYRTSMGRETPAPTWYAGNYGWSDFEAGSFSTFDVAVNTSVAAYSSAHSSGGGGGGGGGFGGGGGGGGGSW